jgi:gliding motility-associated-like protein
MIKKIILKKLFFLFLLFITSFSFSQGDDCSTALQLTNLSNYCSSGGAYTNASATASSYGIASCWGTGNTSDVWFKFIATGSDIFITISGSGKSTGATMQQPEISLSTGTCGSSTITDLRCETTSSSYDNMISLYKGGLTLGTTYFIRISSSSGNRGKFDLCINNFTPVPNPNDPNDCDKATIICNKDAVSVGTLNGAGSNTSEASVGCFAASNESNSTWLHFKCKTTGTLDFDVLGANKSDDIDWVLFEVTGFRNCATKTLLSCNIASCDINGGNGATNERKTGIRPGEAASNLVNGTTVTANSEPSGCAGPPQNGYNNELTITAGKTYALFLNNDSQSSGFSVVWGGTSTFVGPESKITVDKSTICVGESISVNGSTSLDYTTFKWDLPSAAYPTTQTAIGPFNQTFNQTGSFPIVLTTYDNNGCLNVANKMITVNGINADFTAPSVCVGNPTTFTCTTSGLSGLTWDFGDGSTGTGTPTNHTYASPGNYTAKLSVTGGGCSNVFSQTVSVLGATINITPDPAQTCPGNQLTLNATTNVTGNVSGPKTFTQSTAVSIPHTDGFSVGVDDTWDGSFGSGINSASTSDAGSSSLAVTGLNTSNWKINSITVNIATTKPKYLVAYLESPCGNRIKLITRTNSLSGTTGFQTTVFTPTATKTIGSTGNTASPFSSGPYAASESSKWNSNLLSCTNPNGTWKLIVGEYIYGSSGNPSITSWSMDFQSDVPNVIQSIAWSPTTNLSAISYTGTTTASGTASAKTSTAETLTLSVVDKGGCTTTKQITVSVSAPQPPTCNGITVCTGQSGTLTATGGTGATFKWYADNTTNTTIAGSGTSGSFTTPNLNSPISYYVSQVSGGCESTRTKVDVNVTNSNSITLSSAVGTDAQTVCLNTAITNIIYTTTGATGATFSGLPTGVTGTWNAGTITISGSPSVNAGSPYTYTINLTGGCGTVTKTGTISVNQTNTITLSSAVGTDAQTKCINTAITNITYTTTGATGATFSGLPTGVTGNWSANTVTISGSPSTNAGSPFTYTITLTGGCGNVTKTGTITVNPNQTLGVTCGSTTSSSVQFTWNNIPGATYNYSYLINNSGSPTSGSLTSGTTNFTKSGLNPGDIVTISLTPVGGNCVTAETFSCTAVNCGTPIVDAVSAVKECSNTSVTAINFTSPQGAVTFNWTNNNTSIGLPASGTGNISTFTSSTVLTQQVATISVTATQGGCTGPVTTFNITIDPLNTINLTSPAGTDAQTVCNNTAINNITYTTTGATGATFSGLPSGVNGSWSNNVVTISGTPTTASNTPYTYTITLTGGCGTVTKSGTIQVNANNTINLTSALNSDNQNLCVNSTLTNITYATTGATGATFSGLPTGISGSWNAGVVTISGTPTVNLGSPFSYTITLTGGCGTITDNGTITVNPINTINLTSTTNSDNQSVCLNSAITNITYSTTGATGANITGLPSGVTGTWNNNNITITGTPSTNSGSPFTYSISLTGGCGSITATGQISIITVNTINLTSAVGTDNQSICENNSILNITYNTTGATGATFSGLPSGVNGSWNNNTITISGSPTSNIGSPFNYTITLTGGCGTVTKSGSITIAPINTIVLSSNIGTDSQTICVNSALTNITYTTTGAIGATFSGLPVGVNGNWNNNTIIISGTPTQNSTAVYNYQINLTGGCGVVSKNGSITVNSINTIVLTSSPGTDNQKICINNQLKDITYETTGATGATITGLPAGITGQWNNDQINIVGTLTANTGNPFQYNILLTGGCGTVTKTGTIDLKSNNTITLTSNPNTNNQTICLGSDITQINYQTTGATGATISGLPNGVSGSWNNNGITIVGKPAGLAQSYTYTINLNGGCPIADATGSITTVDLPIANPSSNTPCEQENLSMDAGVSGMKNYSWTGPNGFSSNLEKPSITNVTLSAKGLYSLTITDQNNCINTVSFNVIINQVDNIQFADIESTCKNGSVFNLPVVNISGGTWSSDDNTSIQNPYTGVFDPTKSIPDQDYKVVVTYSTKTITPARLCPSTKSKVVFVYPTPDPEFKVRDTLLCITDTLFAEVITKNKLVNYTWDFNNGQTKNDSVVFYIYPKSGIFDLTLTAKLGICSTSKTMKGYIHVVDVPNAIEYTQSVNEIDFYNPEIQFQTTTNAKYYFWDFGDGKTSTYKNPKHTFPETPGEYLVSFSASNLLNKCGMTISRSILMPEPVIYFIPNTFTPNGDELNNTFQPIFTYGYDAQNYSFYIYDRWGSLLFESHDPKIGWDGTFGDNLVQNDTYVWKLEFKEKIQEYKHVKTGHVNVLR